jgi:hypothetical protein
MGKEKTQFTEGNPGRPKGSKNKSLTRGQIAAILNDENTWTKFRAELKKLRGRAYVDALTKLFEYDTPRFSSINFSLSNMSEQDLAFLIETIKRQTNEQSGSH